jgi:hypothetical protein
MSTKRIASATVASLVLVCSQAAVADPWPQSVVGTWNVHANQHTLTLRISSQGTTGNCRAIYGTLQNVGESTHSNVEGFYCPCSGRISFLRKDPTNNDTFQTWTGNLSDPGLTIYMAGTFTSPSFNRGEYDFFAQKSSLTVK